MKVWIGVDPGQGGGICVIHEGGDIDITPMIIGGKGIDIFATTHWICTHTEFVAKACVAMIENVHAMPGQGVSSMFKFGFNTGIIHGILGALYIPIHLATPQAWKKSILTGTDKSKLAAIDYCRRAFPKVSLLATDRSKKPHSGMADALCIAVYARDTYR